MHVYGVLLCLPVALSIIVTDPPPNDNEYKYSYDIEDPVTGDTKSQQEVRRGDVVQGSYSLVEPDGTRRTVEYSADPRHGFTAVIHKEAIPSTPARQAPVYVAKPLNPTVRYTETPQQYDIRNVIPGARTVQRPPTYILKALQSVPYTKSYPNTDYEYKPQPALYFTPANEIAPDRENFAQGQYFQPAAAATDYHENY